MTLQGEGLRTVLHKDGNLASSLTKQNACEIKISPDTKIGVRVTVEAGMVVTSVEDNDEITYKQC